MSFLGKTYKYDRQEKFDEFLKAVGLPAEEVAKYLQSHPTSKLEKDGDEYVYTNVSPAGTKVTKFKSGVEFEDYLKEDLPIKTVYTVEGNKATQLIKTDKGTATFEREYKDNELIVTITSSVWDGTAKRYYKA